MILKAEKNKDLQIENVKTEFNFKIEFGFLCIIIQSDLYFKQKIALSTNNTKCNYKIGQICEVFFYQDDKKNSSIA